MLFGDSHIKCSIRHRLHHDIHRRSRRHCWSHPHDSFILFCQLYQSMPKDILIFWSLWRRRYFFKDLSGYFIKSAWSMPGSFISVFRRGVSFTFYGHTMQYFGSWDISHILQNFHQMIHIVAIYWSEISQVQRFKKIALV